MKKQLLSSALLAITLFLTACSGDDSSPINDGGPDTYPNTSFEIGDTGPGGGIVFYLAADGHGYEVANTLGLAKWEDVDNLYDAIDISGLGTAIGTGAANTELIVNAIGNGNYAAKICADYEHGGKSDWFLPSKDELIAVYNHFRSHWDLNIEVNNHWSSSQGSNNTKSWNTDFSVNSATTPFNNWTFEIQKDQTLYVVPIRKF
ncbi:hypothetical protein [Flavobacterium sp.]|uniref:hypothetical protein n=1 Tax=Flavobacterium sp. TaxID=239 RepID=UPI004034EDD5